jgi:DNA polymerase-3 subunit gamma/tau
MAYQVLARKYRPQRFSDVYGQDHVTRTLINALTQKRIAHGYIFSGHRGIGKTTIARILAMALDCRSEVGSDIRPTVEPCLTCVSCREIASGGNASGDTLASNSFDFIEIDAASNRGIDDVRSICAQADVRPARDKYKIFLLDEAHQITDAAFNAILKTLEEPPDWAIFMMATTEPESIPQTIRSRCQHFSFHAVKFDDIFAQLKAISERENIVAEDAALALLAEAGDGSMRDALSIMDQAIASAPLENGKAVLQTDQIRDLMGAVPNAVFERLLESVSAQDSAKLMEELNQLINNGNSPSALARQLVRYLRNCLMSKLGGENTQLLEIAQDERARAHRTAQLFTEEDLTRNLQIALRTFDELNYRQEQRFHLELGLLKLIQAQRLLPVEELLSGMATQSGNSSIAPKRPGAPASAAPATRPAQSLAPISTPISAPVSTPRPATTPAAPAAPSLSPFAASNQRSQAAVEIPIHRPTRDIPTASIARETSRQPITTGMAVPAEPSTIGALALDDSSHHSSPDSSPDSNHESSRDSGNDSSHHSSEQSYAKALSAKAPAMESGPHIVPPAQTLRELIPAQSSIPVAAPAEIPEPAAIAKTIPPASIPASVPSEAATTDEAIEPIRAAVVQSLTAGGHGTAAILLEDGKWTLEPSSIRIEVGAKATMIRITFNPQAEKLIRAGLTQAGAPSRFLIVPGDALASSGAPVKRQAPVGSIEAEARNNPLVLQAQSLFNAEIVSVVDLRT